MAPPPPSPLERAAKALAQVLATRVAAERWFAEYFKIVGPLAVVDTEEKGSVVRVYRRMAQGSREVVPWVSVVWSGGGRLGTVFPPGGMDEEGTHLPAPPPARAELKLHHGLQSISLVYGPDGVRFETCINPLHQGRLVELVKVLKGAKDPLLESAHFVAGLDDTTQGSGKLHYPVPAPGGVVGAWSQGLRACRRALHDGRVPPTARFVVADALEGRAVAWGTSLEEALVGYNAEVARALPEQRHTLETAFDDYDDEGNLIARGELPLGLSPQRGEDGDEPPEGVFDGEAPPAPEMDPLTGNIDFGVMMLRGPASDNPPVPKRAECVPHVIVPLELSPPGAPPQGRWVRLLGDLGTTRHAVRVKHGDGYLLVGADLLGHVDLRTLRTEVDRLEAEEAPQPWELGAQGSEMERYVRYQVKQFRWQPASEDRPEGLVFVEGSAGPRFDAGCLDGDRIQARVYRHRRVLRPVD